MQQNMDRKSSTLEKVIYFFVKINNDDIFALAAQLAYYLILSFFPFLIFVITLIGISNLDSITVLYGLKSILPDNVFNLVDNTVLEIVNKQNVGLLGISIVLSMWSASSGIRAVIRGINKAYDLKEKRGFISLSILSLIFTISLTLIIIITLIALVFGDIIGKYLYLWLPFPEVVRILWNIIRYLVVILSMVFIFGTLYRYAPTKKMRWKKVLPGSIFTSIGWIIVSTAFSYYVNNISNYSRLYGSLGAVFVLMIWLYLTSIILILGAEINSELDINKNKF